MRKLLFSTLVSVVTGLSVCSCGSGAYKGNADGSARVAVTEKSRSVSVSDTDIDHIISLAEAALTGNDMITDRALTDGDISSAKCKGVYVDVEYPDKRTLEIGSSKRDISVGRIEILIFDDRKYIAYTSDHATEVFLLNEEYERQLYGYISY